MKMISKEKLDLWKKLIEEKNQSGLLVKDFCKEKNITPATFYYYHAIVNGDKKSHSTKKGKTNFQPIKLAHSAQTEQSVIRFILPNGLQCVFPRNISPQEIKNIMEIIRSC